VVVDVLIVLEALLVELETLPTLLHLKAIMVAAVITEMEIVTI
jgi:hypothetical protein